MRVVHTKTFTSFGKSGGYVDIYLHINYCQLLILRRLKISFNFLSYEMTNYLKSVNRN